MIRLVSLGCQCQDAQGLGGLFGQVVREALAGVPFQRSPDCGSRIRLESVVGRGTGCRSLNVHCGLNWSSKGHGRASRRPWDQVLSGPSHWAQEATVSILDLTLPAKGKVFNPHSNPCGAGTLLTLPMWTRRLREAQ